mmetsp:Transcript_8710/g.12876  ORF Transcript_8710/g.12876 Transcript_8710/m.12876 type:complete len:226 (+) Transcript_8710:79-756(+)
MKESDSIIVFNAHSDNNELRQKRASDRAKYFHEKLVHFKSQNSPYNIIEKYQKLYNDQMKEVNLMEHYAWLNPLFENQRVIANIFYKGCLSVKEDIRKIDIRDQNERNATKNRNGASPWVPFQVLKVHIPQTSREDPFEFIEPEYSECKCEGFPKNHDHLFNMQQTELTNLVKNLGLSLPIEVYNDSKLIRSRFMNKVAIDLERYITDPCFFWNFKIEKESDQGE